ncbi:hypothetical protein AcV5_009741 [Taiwanofungus camphoratus]|nr:hypothetical protein AcV5_009741 [Antrodia cinnamomea]
MSEGTEIGCSFGGSRARTAPVLHFDPDIVVKTGRDIQPWEARMMELVRTQTSVPTPRVLRFFTKGDRSYFVKGHTLERCRDKLSIWRKIKVA